MAYSHEINPVIEFWCTEARDEIQEVHAGRLNNLQKFVGKHLRTSPRTGCYSIALQHVSAPFYRMLQRCVTASYNSMLQHRGTACYSILKQHNTGSCTSWISGLLMVGKGTHVGLAFKSVSKPHAGGGRQRQATSWRMSGALVTITAFSTSVLQVGPPRSPCRSPLSPAPHVWYFVRLYFEGKGNQFWTFGPSFLTMSWCMRVRMRIHL